MTVRAGGGDAVWQLLELISIADPETEAFERAEHRARAIESADELLIQAARHALMPSLTDFLVRAGLLGIMPSGVKSHLLGALQWNRVRSAAYTEEAIRIVSAFRARGVPVACNKGVVVQYSLYDGRGTRQFGDIDLMVSPDHGAAAGEVLLALGYASGKEYDHRSRTLVDLARPRQLIYRLFPDHLPHFFRIPDTDLIPFFVTDVALSLTWHGGEWTVPMDEAFSDLGAVAAETAQGTAQLPALDDPYGFLFLVLHLFREAWFERTIQSKDIRLFQFADIWRFWDRYGRERSADIRRLISRYELGAPVAWVCHHLDGIYGGDLVGELALEAHCDDRWLNGAGAKRGGRLCWEGSFRDRLRSRSPLELRESKE